MIKVTRLTARVGGVPIKPNTAHYQGFPEQLGHGSPENLKSAVSVAIEENIDGVFLFRFSADGQVVGDTWHMSVEEAKEQAIYEYGALLGEWVINAEDG